MRSAPPPFFFFCFFFFGWEYKHRGLNTHGFMVYLFRVVVQTEKICRMGENMWEEVSQQKLHPLLSFKFSLGEAAGGETMSGINQQSEKQKESVPLWNLSQKKKNPSTCDEDDFWRFLKIIYVPATWRLITGFLIIQQLEGGFFFSFCFFLFVSLLRIRIKINSPPCGHRSTGEVWNGH